MRAGNVCEEFSEMPEKVSNAGSISLRELVGLVAGPRDWLDNRKSWLTRAARRIGISGRQAKALFYQEITDADHRSARLLRDKAAAIYEETAAALSAADPLLHRKQIDALRAGAYRLRGGTGPRADQAGGMIP
jgi:hypothetical protein